jgi:hypothetical protein
MSKTMSLIELQAVLSQVMREVLDSDKTSVMAWQLMEAIKDDSDKQG